MMMKKKTPYSIVAVRTEKNHEILETIWSK